jgi:hypothetical protein
VALAARFFIITKAQQDGIPLLCFLKLEIMKKIILLIFVCFIAINLSAQAFKKGDVMLSPGVGLGVYGVGYGVGFTVPVILNFDVGVHDYVSVGAYGGFWTRKWDYGFGDNYRFTSSHFGARATFHFWQLIDAKVDADLLGDKLDIYFTPWFGYNLRTVKWVDNGGVSPFNLSYGSRFQGGAQLGVRYFLNDHIGFFGEWGGTPTAYSNFGMSFKF